MWPWRNTALTRVTLQPICHALLCPPLVATLYATCTAREGCILALWTLIVHFTPDRSFRIQYDSVLCNMLQSLGLERQIPGSCAVRYMKVYRIPSDKASCQLQHGPNGVLCSSGRAGSPLSRLVSQPTHGVANWTLVMRHENCTYVLLTHAYSPVLDATCDVNSCFELSSPVHLETSDVVKHGLRRVHHPHSIYKWVCYRAEHNSPSAQKRRQSGHTSASKAAHSHAYTSTTEANTLTS